MANRPWLLVVEDNLDDVFALEYELKKAGVSNPAMRVVTDGQQALDYLAGNGRYADREAFPLPVLVLLDLKLPFYSGHEILKWIRSDADLATLPVVILSGSDESRDHAQAIENGATDYLVKPASRQDIRRILEAQGLSFEAISRPPAA